MMNMSIQKKILLGFLGVFFLIFLFTAGSIWENVDNSEIVVIQSVDGTMRVIKTAGIYMQNYGKVTRYKKRSQFWFSKKNDEGNASDESIKIRFNEGGHATLSGSVSYYMPSDDKAILKIHTDFGSQEAIEHQLVKQVVTKSVYMTGPLMSSKESSAEKRTDLLSYIEDQAMNGVYKTIQEAVKTKDELTGAEKVITVVKIVLGKGGIFERQEESPAKIYNVQLSSLTINSIDYDDAVEKQIKDQQHTTMMIQQAIANSKKAEQDAITAELMGKAAAATAKWTQEVEKAKAVTIAQQEKEVAALDAQTAIFAAAKVKTEADAAFYQNSKMVSAGLTPQQRADYAMKTAIGVAAEIAKIKLPETYISGNTGGGSANMLESILGVKLLNQGTK